MIWRRFRAWIESRRNKNMEESGAGEVGDQGNDFDVPL